MFKIKYNKQIIILIKLTIYLIKLNINIKTINNYLIPYLSIDILPKPLTIIPTINN